MKKVLFMLLTVVLVLSLMACNGETAQPTDSTTAPTTQTEGSVPTEPSGGVTEPDTQPSDPTEGTTAPSEPDVEPSEPEEDPSVPSEPSHEHSYTTAVTNPTCTEDGYTTYTCACGDSYVSDQVAAKGHSYTSKVTAPTCTAEGYTTYTCACGDSYVGDKINAKGHSFGAWVTVKEPTTSATGKAERKCSACSAKEERILDKIIEDHTHSYTGKVTKSPTCTAEGVKTYTCSCGGSYTESIAATGHNYTSKVTKQPTCSAEGVKTYTCSKCNGSYTESIAKLSHSYSATVVKPTCTEKGYTKHTCKTCSHSYNDTYTNATGHNYSSKVTTAATCDTNGVKTYTCSKCSDRYTEVIKAAHNYDAEVVKPTCHTQGYTMYTCGDCWDNYVTDYTAATGSTYTRVTTEPSCSQYGYEATYCGICDEWLSAVQLPRTGECKFTVTMRMNKAVGALEAKGIYTYGTWGGYTDWNVEVCSVCGDIDLESLRFAYTDRQAAEIMMGYVNDLREEVYGTTKYNLVLDDTLIELAKIRAKELSVNYAHGGTFTNASENICCQQGIYLHYQEWYNSAGHYKVMVNKKYKYFGYATYADFRQGYNVEPRFYGVQLFWDEESRATYFE